MVFFCLLLLVYSFVLRVVLVIATVVVVAAGAVLKMTAANVDHAREITMQQ